MKETADMLSVLLGGDKDLNSVESFTWIDDGATRRTVIIEENNKADRSR